MVVTVSPIEAEISADTVPAVNVVVLAVKVHATSRSNFFKPIFMVQPAENISRSYPAIGWQLMRMDAWARPRPAVGIRNAWPQARMRSSLIVMGNPLSQDRPKMLLAQRD